MEYFILVPCDSEKSCEVVCFDGSCDLIDFFYKFFPDGFDIGSTSGGLCSLFMVGENSVYECVANFRSLFFCEFAFGDVLLGFSGFRDGESDFVGSCNLLEMQAYCDILNSLRFPYV